MLAGAGIIGPGLVNVGGNGLSNLSQGSGLDTAFTQLRSLSEDREINSFDNAMTDANGNSESRSQLGSLVGHMWGLWGNCEE